MSLFTSLIPSHSQTATEDSSESAERTVKPAYEIKETPEAWGVTVLLPGVAKDGLEVTVEEGQLRVIGRRAWKQPTDWSPVYRETADATFELALNHDNAVQLDAVAAELQHGVLRVSLPKQESLKPRKIAVK